MRAGGATFIGWLFNTVTDDGTTGFGWTVATVVVVLLLIV
jgi:hypothetical protein